MTSFFPNPGWAWLYLAPTAVLLLWFCFELRTRSLKILSFSSLMLVSFASLKTEQRGAYLLVLGLLGIATYFGFIRQRLSSRRRLVGLLGNVSAIVIAVAIFRSEINDRLISILHLNKLVLAASGERLAMWQNAWNIFQANPFLGSGYASWFSEMSHISVEGKEAFVYDTAHNLWIQLFVELGILHGLLITAILMVLAGLLIKSDWSTSRYKGLLILSLLWSFAFCRLVQEIDYIRPHILFLRDS